LPASSAEGEPQPARRRLPSRAATSRLGDFIGCIRQGWGRVREANTGPPTGDCLAPAPQVAASRP